MAGETTIRAEEPEEYLGDGVYASHDGFYVWLRVNRYGVDERIALEGLVYKNLQDYVERLRKENKIPEK